MHVVAAKALCFKEALDPEFKTYTKQVMDNAKIMAETIMSNGVDIVCNGTENHIILVDLRSKGITGKDLERVLGSVNITVNKNSVPNDPASPFVTSGIRIGTPAVTTRGFKKEEIIKVSNWISDIINDFENEKLQKNIKQEVQNLTNNFPVYNV
jgi:glycine hydroxymethyltransferase